MNDPFVPLNKNSASGRNRTDVRVSILNQPDNLPAFQSLGHGAHGGAAGQCSPCGVVASDVPAGLRRFTPQGEPRVTLQRDGERVSSIRIQCSCGQVIELACVYSNPLNT